MPRLQVRSAAPTWSGLRLPRWPPGPTMAWIVTGSSWPTCSASERRHEHRRRHIEPLGFRCCRLWP